MKRKKTIYVNASEKKLLNFLKLKLNTAWVKKKKMRVELICTLILVIPIKS